MRRFLLLTICFLTFTFGYAQTQTITIPWDFFSVPATDPNFSNGEMFDTNIVIEEGDTVVWDWLSGGHNVKSDGESAEGFGTPGGEFDTFPFGYTHSYTFTIVGIYNFECVPHESIMYGSITVVPEGTLSITSSEIANFSMTPNPAKSKLTINLSQNSDSGTIAVYDVLGKKIYSQLVDDLSSSIDVSNWNAGVYLVRISTNTQTTTKRFVKQ